MKKLYIILLILASFSATKSQAYNLNLEEAYAGSFLKVEELYVEYRKYQAYRNPYYPEDKNDWTHTGEFHWNVSIFDRLYWNNNFHISMDKSPQVRHGGWEYYIGFKVLQWFDLIRYHHSEHSFDQQQDKKFPVEDSVGVRVYFKTKE